MSLRVEETPASQPAEFSTTHWSLITLGAATDEEKRRNALTELCRTYWRPIFLYICRRGYSFEDAQDLTQDFFAKILEMNWLGRADKSRGRFRALLLKSLKNFLIDAGEKRSAKKRGGGVEFISWDDWMAEAPSHLSISARAMDNLAPERLFDLRWAATVVEEAMRRLADECQKNGRLRLFETLSGHLASDRTDICYTDVAASLGVTEPTVKRQLHNLRQRYRWLLRDEISRTVADPADVDEEIRHLCAALAAAE
ncbi:MAG: sigma-70 family RNA polymerase sigma factor [Verrucomicrobiota bacterium]|nr:sigma-70 family RNA polymerase sigma factor [Verrucomicrobiota bacterium]